MLSKKYRLPVQSVLSKRGTIIRGRYFFIKIFPTEKTYSRAGVVVSSKTAAKATSRNRLKRAVYNEITKSLSSLPVHDYVITTQTGAYEALSNGAMISELNSLLKQH